MVATDLGKRPKQSSSPASVKINVMRNQHPPRFSKSQYTKQIKRTQKVNEVLLSVKANDDDDKQPYNQITYSIIGDDNAASLFSVGTKSGQISLKNSINSLTQTEFKV